MTGEVQSQLQDIIPTYIIYIFWAFPMEASSSRALPALPEWQIALSQHRSGAHQAEVKVLSAAQREQVARERLARLKAKAQRELTRAASAAAASEAVDRKREMVRAVRDDLDRRSGRAVATKIASVQPLDDKMAKLVSAQCHSALARAFPPDERSFFKVFKVVVTVSHTLPPVYGDGHSSCTAICSGFVPADSRALAC